MPRDQTRYGRTGLSLVQAVNDAQIALVLRASALMERLALNPGALLEASQRMTSAAQQIARKVHPRFWRWATIEVPGAYLRGIQAARAEMAAAGVEAVSRPEAALESPLRPRPQLGAGIAIGGVPDGFEPFPQHLHLVEVFRQAAAGVAGQIELQLIRAADDVVREVTELVASSAFRDSATFTRRGMSKKLLDGLAKKGLGHIQYSNGRKVTLEAYAEMVGRTTTGRSALAGSLARYQEAGYDLVLVSAHFRTCQLCAPWEGEILSQTGQSEKYQPLQTAIDQGLLHPNCAHGLVPFIPGLTERAEVATRMHPAEAKLVEDLGYRGAQEHTFRAQMRQRQIERRIRHWKRRAAVGGDPGETAKTRINMWRKEMRQHLKDNPYLRRKPVRESLRAA